MLQMMNRVWMGIATLFLGSSLASAQPADPAATPPPPEPPLAPPAAAPAMQPAPSEPVRRGFDLGVMNDANASRGWMSPTALTEPGGTWSISDYELFLLQVGYAVNDQLMVSATTIPPFTSDFPLWLLFSAKLQVLKAGRVRAAIQGAFTFVSSKNSDLNSFTAGDVGGALTLCIDEDCHSH